MSVLSSLTGCLVLIVAGVLAAATTSAAEPATLDVMVLRGSFPRQAVWRPYDGGLPDAVRHRYEVRHGIAPDTTGRSIELAFEPDRMRPVGGIVIDPPDDTGLRLVVVLDRERRLRRAGIYAAPLKPAPELSSMIRHGTLTRFTAMSLRQLRFVAGQLARESGIGGRIAARIHGLAVTLAAVLDNVAIGPQPVLRGHRR